jgi:uncharacterized membrane protein
MEPEWMKPVKSRTVCDFYYFFFWFQVILSLIIVTLMIFTLSMVKKGSYDLVGLLLTQFVILSITVTHAMFNYIMCERALFSPEK